MNFTAILATLELKGIITREEGEKITEFLNNKPQSTLLADAVEQVKEFVDKDIAATKGKVEATAKKATGEALKDAATAVEDDVKGKKA